MRSRETGAGGILLVDKDAGVSSHDVVDTARRALGVKRIGHAGTLDPFATGLLVLLVGRATRLAPYVDGEPKIYRAAIRFGTETDTDDVTGAVTREAPLADAGRVRDGIAQLTGEIDQLPPAYSAKQVDGRRSYDAARRGESLALRAARVRVDAWEVHALSPSSADVTITCGGGTYVRALARDLGRLAGSAAHLAALRRMRSGAFDVSDAVGLDALRLGEGVLRPPLAALGAMPVDAIDAAAVARVARGQCVPAHIAGARSALVDGAGTVIAIAERRGDEWHPRVVLCDA